MKSRQNISNANKNISAFFLRISTNPNFIRFIKLQTAVIESFEIAKSEFEINVWADEVTSTLKIHNL